MGSGECLRPGLMIMGYSLATCTLLSTCRGHKAPGITSVRGTGAVGVFLAAWFTYCAPSGVPWSRAMLILSHFATYLRVCGGSGTIQFYIPG